MDLTRRQFTTAAGSALALTVLHQAGCGRPGPTTAPATTSAPADRAILAQDLVDEPFLAGPIEPFRKPGIYANFADKGIWLYSDGARLVAISAICTHMGTAIGWHPGLKEFVCPKHNSHFTADGTVLPNQKAKRPLDRLGIAIVDTPEGKQVRIDPTKSFVRDPVKEVDEFGQSGASVAI